MHHALANHTVNCAMSIIYSMIKLYQSMGENMDDVVDNPALARQDLQYWYDNNEQRDGIMYSRTQHLSLLLCPECADDGLQDRCLYEAAAASRKRHCSSFCWICSGSESCLPCTSLLCVLLWVCGTC